MRSLVPLLALLASGCASGGWRTSWLAVAPCAPADAAPGTLLLKVVDSGGVPLPGAVVQARVRNRTPISTAVADRNGNARLQVTPSSETYELKASLAGFHPTCIEEVRPVYGCTTELRLPLRLASR